MQAETKQYKNTILLHIGLKRAAYVLLNYVICDCKIAANKLLEAHFKEFLKLDLQVQRFSFKTFQLVNNR